MKGQTLGQMYPRVSWAALHRNIRCVSLKREILKGSSVNTASADAGGLWYGGSELWGLGKYSSPLSRGELKGGQALSSTPPPVLCSFVGGSIHTHKHIKLSSHAALTSCLGSERWPSPLINIESMQRKASRRKHFTFISSVQVWFNVSGYDISFLNDRHSAAAVKCSLKFLWPLK